MGRDVCGAEYDFDEVIEGLSESEMELIHQLESTGDLTCEPVICDRAVDHSGSHIARRGNHISVWDADTFHDFCAQNGYDSIASWPRWAGVEPLTR